MGGVCCTAGDDGLLSSKIEKLLFVEKKLETGVSEMQEIFGAGGTTMPDFGILSNNGDHVRAAYAVIAPDVTHHKAMLDSGDYLFVQNFLQVADERASKSSSTASKGLSITSNGLSITYDGISISKEPLESFSSESEGVGGSNLKIVSNEPLDIPSVTPDRASPECIDSWRERCAINQQNAVQEHDKYMVTVVFEPGSLGVDLNVKCGTIKTIKEGQALAKGACEGWKIVQIDGRTYSESLLVECIKGEDDYVVTFLVPEDLKEIQCQKLLSDDHLGRSSVSSDIPEDEISVREFFTGFGDLYQQYEDIMQSYFSHNSPLDIRYQDLRRIGVGNAHHRALIMERIEFLRNQAQYLHQIFCRLPRTPCFMRYRQLFRISHVDETTAQYLDEDTLISWGIKKVLHRDAILRSIKFANISKKQNFWQYPASEALSSEPDLKDVDYHQEKSVDKQSDVPIKATPDSSDLPKRFAGCHRTLLE